MKTSGKIVDNDSNSTCYSDKCSLYEANNVYMSRNNCKLTGQLVESHRPVNGGNRPNLAPAFDSSISPMVPVTEMETELDKLFNTLLNINFNKS